MMAERIWKPPKNVDFFKSTLGVLADESSTWQTEFVLQQIDPKKLVYVVFCRKYMQFLDHHTAGALLHPTVHATGDFLLAPDKKPLTDHSSDFLLSLVS